MKTSILNKARWLQALTLAGSSTKRVNPTTTSVCSLFSLDSILSRLCLASLICPPSEEKELNWLRAEIDELDETLWDTLAARMEVSQRIGEWKKAHDVSPLQQARYEQIVEKLKEKGERFKEAGLSTDFILRIWDLIHEQSLRQQE